MAAVAVLAVGNVGYVLAARQAILSLLAHSDFQVHVTTDRAGSGLLPQDPRVHVHVADIRNDHRADRFIGKFTALANCLDQCSDEVIVLMDADAVLARRLLEDDLRDVLSGFDFGMVEQRTIIGSDMGRKQFLAHYTTNSLAFLAPDEQPPAEADFRFYNSGVVVGRRTAFRDFLEWVTEVQGKRPPNHSVGAEMIADQDYFQVWANTVRPGRTVELPWGWNHCDKWDQGFPRADARILHFSNFCNGPELATINQMRRHAMASDRRITKSGEDTELSIVTVAYNSAEPLSLCLDFTTALGCRVLVVDNSSSDDTVSVCQKADVDLVVNERNVGFGAAVNQAVELVSTEVICILNPDCLLTAETVTAALGLLREHPNSMVVPKFVDWDGHEQDGRQQSYSAWRLIADILQGNGASAIARPLYRWADRRDGVWQWPVGACIFVRTDVFQQLGGFDPRYFCYMEDVQLGRDAWRSGVDVLSLGFSVPHFGARGSRITTDRRDRLLNEARLTYARANYPGAFALGLSLLDKSLARSRKLWRRLRTARRETAAS